MRSWSTACPDWEKRIVAGQSLIPFEPLFPDEAEAALAVFKSLRVVDVLGSPTFGECCDEWVFDFVRAIFGAYDHESATRLIEEFFLLISKKNAKSTIAAGIMVTALIRNWRRSAELLILAPTIEIAKNSFEPARDMVFADDDLRNLLHVQENVRTITHRVTNAKLKVVAADTETVGGKKAAFILVDELWIFGKRAGASGMLQEATGGMMSRPEGFVIYLSTQSDEPPAGVFKEKLDYFRDVRDGKINDRRSLPVLYEFPEEFIREKTYLDPENFRLTNPNLGRSVRQAWLERKLDLVNSGEDEEGDTIQTFLAKHLNVEIGMGLRANRWPGAEYWSRGEDETITKESLFERCDVIVVGNDGGGLDDLWGLCLLGRDRDTRNWIAWAHAWCHKSVLTRRKKIASRLLDFEEAGELTIVDDELGDIREIVEIIVEVRDKGLLGAVAVDPAGLGELIEELAAVDITEENDLVLGVPQGFALMNAIKTCERKLANGTLKHAKSSLMDWAVHNLKIEPTATAIRATKQTAGDAKIDPVMGFFDAAFALLRDPKPYVKPNYQLFLVA